jgi:hypothetical protein
MPNQLAIGVLRSRRDARLKELAKTGPLLQGSMTQNHLTCGNPNCRCARGERHTAYQVTRKVNGKTKTLYIPKDLVEDVQVWIEEHRRVKELLKEISELNEQIIRGHVKSKRARARNQAAAERERGTASN